MAKKFIHTYGDRLEGYSQYTVTVVAIGRLRVPLGVIVSSWGILVGLSVAVAGILHGVSGDPWYWLIVAGTAGLLVSFLLVIGIYAYVAWAARGVRGANK